MLAYGIWRAGTDPALRFYLDWLSPFHTKVVKVAHLNLFRPVQFAIGIDPGFWTGCFVWEVWQALFCLQAMLEGSKVLQH